MAPTNDFLDHMPAFFWFQDIFCDKIDFLVQEFALRYQEGNTSIRGDLVERSNERTRDKQPPRGRLICRALGYGGAPRR